MHEHRNHIRTSMRCQVKLWHKDIGEIVVDTRDISDGGIFLLTEDIPMPPIGSILKGQVQGLVGDAPIVTLEIVRVEPAGIGLKFVNS